MSSGNPFSREVSEELYNHAMNDRVRPDGIQPEIPYIARLLVPESLRPPYAVDKSVVVIDLNDSTRIPWALIVETQYLDPEFFVEHLMDEEGFFIAPNGNRAKPATKPEHFWKIGYLLIGSTPFSELELHALDASLPQPPVLVGSHN